MKTTARTFKSLADETRLRILSLLGGGELCVCDLVAALRLPQSTVSRHLAYLKQTGWVIDRREAVWIYYTLSPAMTPLQRALLTAAEAALVANTTAVADRERLAGFSQDNSCA